VKNDAGNRFAGFRQLAMIPLKDWLVSQSSQICYVPDNKKRVGVASCKDWFGTKIERECRRANDACQSSSYVLYKTYHNTVLAGRAGCFCDEIRPYE
jgi:hypothetical protein